MIPRIQFKDKKDPFLGLRTEFKDKKDLLLVLNVENDRQKTKFRLQSSLVFIFLS